MANLHKCTIVELKNSAYAMLETGCLVGGFSFLHGCLGSLLSNVLRLCVRWGFPALKPIESTNFNLITNDYR
jgi:hypothetical protein